MRDPAALAALIGAVAAAIVAVIKAVGSWRSDGAMVANLEKRVKELEDQAKESDRRHREELDAQERRHDDALAVVRRDLEAKNEALQQEVRRLMQEHR